MPSSKNKENNMSALTPFIIEPEAQVKDDDTNNTSTTVKNAAILGPLVAQPNIIRRIASFANEKTLHSCILIGRTWYDEVAPFLFARLDMTPHQGRGIFEHMTR